MSAELLVQIQIPEGVETGSKVNIPLEDGRTFEIIVPYGVSPGDVINVEIPALAESDAQSKDADAKTIKTMTGSRVAMGAAVAAGVTGTLVMGPIVGVVAAVLSVYATTRDDKIGDAARGAGAMTAVAYDKAVEADQKYSITEKIRLAGSATIAKAKEIDDEYKIVEKTKAAGIATIKKAQEINEEYKIVESTKAAAIKVAAQAKEINEKYEITDKASRAIAQGLSSAKELNEKYEISDKAAKAVNVGLSKALSFMGSMRAPANASAVNATSNDCTPVAEARVV